MGCRDQPAAFRRGASLIDSSRRQFMLTASVLDAATFFTAPSRAANVWSLLAKDKAFVSARRPAIPQRHNFRNGTIGGTGKVWRSEEAVFVAGRSTPPRLCASRSQATSQAPHYVVRRDGDRAVTLVFRRLPATRLRNRNQVKLLEAL